MKWPDYPRAQIRDRIDAMRRTTGSPMPAIAVDEIVDIALHAAASARLAMMETLDRASEPAVATTALGIAASMVKADMDHLEGALTKYAEAKGKPLFRERIMMGGPAHG